jgi:hypothetical protein
MEEMADTEFRWPVLSGYETADWVGRNKSVHDSTEGVLQWPELGAMEAPGVFESRLGGSLHRLKADSEQRGRRWNE